MVKMDLYNQVRKVPSTAQKIIAAGRLKGMTDINPMWRIQALTEQFGPCGIGWKPEIVSFWMTPGANEQIAAFCQINLYTKDGGEWSEPIPGIGGSMFVASERNGLHVSDECYKMAYTDAISVACKSLGFGADVYWAAGGDSKYARQDDAQRQAKQAPPKEPPTMTEGRWVSFWDRAGADGWTKEEVEELAGGDISSYNVAQLSVLWDKMQAKRKEVV